MDSLHAYPLIYLIKLFCDLGLYFLGLLLIPYF